MRVVADHQPVEVVTRVPAGVRRVVVTIDVEPGEPARPPPDLVAGRRTSAAGPAVRHRPGAAGRERRRVRERASALDAIRAAGQTRARVHRPASATALHPGLRGVVIVGGYDVVPAQRRDCLPEAMRASLGVTDDPDDFIVWTDDDYGDDGDRETPPVPGEPDSRRALGAAAARRAVRRRGAATDAAACATASGRSRRTSSPRCPGDDALMVSAPTTFDGIAALDADLVYLMLHGDYVDGSRFWGEGPAGNIEAVNVNNIPDDGPRVVFTGCCWGALTVDQPAHRTLAAGARRR